MKNNVSIILPETKRYLTILHGEMVCSVIDSPFTSMKMDIYHQLRNLRISADKVGEQVITKRIGNGTYYLLNDVVRQKTNRPVPIIFKKDMISAPLMEYYLSTSGEWLIPSNCHTGNPVTDRKHLYSIEKSINLHLRKATGLDITYYSCRHSYATHYINSEGSNPVCLATMMGRSVNGIFRYVKTLTSDEEIIKERMRMGL